MMEEEKEEEEEEKEKEEEVGGGLETGAVGKVLTRMLGCRQGEEEEEGEEEEGGKYRKAVSSLPTRGRTRTWDVGPSLPLSSLSSPFPLT